MSRLSAVADETLAIVERGWYVVGSGRVDLRSALDAALGGTRLHRPADLVTLPVPSVGTSTARVELWACTTGEAARRLSAEGPVSLLDFASAKNPGGGFLRGAKAQEEDLARCSALYACQLRAPGYYEANRATRSMLYTDHLIHSPRVPFFRDERLRLLEQPYLASVVTAPAPNAGQHLRRDPAGRPAVERALARRAELVLRLMAADGARTIVLGAWGCGVFRNDPSAVAHTFRRWLTSSYGSAFDRVVFAVHDRTGDRTVLRAFERALAQEAAEPPPEC